MKSRFSVAVGGDKYRDGWKRTFKNNSDRTSSVDDKNKSDIRKQVEEFHVAFGCPVEDTPIAPSACRVRLRARLIAEEFFETLEAMFGPDTTLENARECVGQAIALGFVSVNLVELADGLADLDYVVEGARLEFGINGKPIADEVHRSNMSKLGLDGKPVYREDGKVIKPAHYSPANVAGELEKQRRAE